MATSIERIQMRRDSAANWVTNNPTLTAGEIGFETDTDRFKIGDAATAWTSLQYANNAYFTSGAGTSLTATTEATTRTLFPAANDTITLPIGTYFLMLDLAATRGTTSTTSAALRVRFSTGTSVGTFSGNAVGSGANTASATAHLLNGVAFTASTVVSDVSTTASSIYISKISGVLRVTTAGTFIPAYSLSANLASAATTTDPAASNYMIIQSLSNSGTVAAFGGWA